MTEYDLYGDLGVASDASFSEIKKAYRKQALLNHPDKHPDKEDAHKKFQRISFAYTILSDEKKRAKYDRTGSVEDTELEDLQFDNISKEMIEEDRKAYQGSQEEINDILYAYEESEGDLDWVFESVPHSELERDEERITKIIKEQIEQKNAKPYAKFTKETEKEKKKRRKDAKKEAAEAEELAKELGLGDTNNDLALMIKNRQQKRQTDFLDQLEEKYAKPKKSKKTKK